MKAWPVQDAKARFSELLDTCLAEGPQMVTRRGGEVAVLVPAEEWRRLRQASRPSLKTLLMAKTPRFEPPPTRRGHRSARLRVALE